MKMYFFILLFFILQFNLVFPQTFSWEKTNGPYGGFISVIYQSSSGKVYAGARGLLYTKYSNEEEWSLALRTNSSSGATTIVENSQGEIFVSFGIGTYHSIDDGVTWQLLNSGIADVKINKLTIDDQDNLYTSALISLTCKIYKSTDNGLSWFDIYSYNPTAYDFYDIEAGQNGLILAGGESPYKLLRSDDYGMTWNSISYPNLNSVIRILISSNIEMYAAESNKKIWKSTDGGTNWFIVGLAPTEQMISDLKKDSLDNLYLGLKENLKYLGWAGNGGVYKSTDGGETWGECLTYDLTNREVLSIALIDSNRLWIGTYGNGVQELAINDSTWIKSNYGMRDININSVVFDTSGSIWLCTSRGGIYFSSDSGNEWEEHSDGLISPTGYEIKVADDNSLFLAQSYGLYKFNYSENTWVKKLEENENTIHCLEIAERDTIYVGSINGGIAVSYDNGTSWVWKPPYYFGTNSIKILNDRNVLAAGNWVYRSTDNGESWNYFYSCGGYNHLILEQTPEDLLLTACITLTNGYLFLSMDYGQTQINLTENINNPYLSCLKYENNKIYLGTTAQGIFVSSDFGNTWQAINDGLDNLYIRSLAIDSLGFIYAGTSEGLYKSSAPVAVPVEIKSFYSTVSENNVELKWQTSTETNNQGFEIQRNFENKKWITIGFKKGAGTTTESQTYTFTDYSLLDGEYKYRLKQIDFNGSYNYSNSIDIRIDAPVIFSLSQNYPNPFNPATKIKYQLPELSKVRLTIYDVLGRKIKILVDQEKPAGKYEVEFDGTNYPSGVYLYKIEAGKYSNTKKLLLLK